MARGCRMAEGERQFRETARFTMRLTSKGEYALLALVFLARQPKDHLVHAEAIADAQEIPKPFLQQILHAMVRARLVRAVKGRDGGYGLAKKPKEITLAEVVRLFDGHLAPNSSSSKFFYAPTPIEREPQLLGLFQEVRELIARKLERATLADYL